MQIKAKLISALLPLSIAPIFILGFLNFNAAQKTIFNQITQRLNALADIQEERINEILDRRSEVFEEEIIALASGFTGDTETGEMILGKKNKNGDIEYIHKRRFESSAKIGRVISKERLEVPIVQAFLKEESAIFNSIDYRLEPVITVVKYIPRANLGLEVKVDKAEAYREIYKLRNQLIIASFLLIFAIVLISLYISKSLSGPIKKLDHYAKQISKGNLKIKMDHDMTRSNDEVGNLTRSFSHMNDRILNFYAQLEKKVKERTNDLQKFKLAIEESSEPIIITKSDGTIVFANSAVSKTTGYSSKEIIGNKPSLWGGQMKPAFYKAMWKKIKNKKAYSGVLTNRRKNGENYIAQLDINPVLDEKQNISFFVGIHRDITKEMEIDKAKTEFVSLASHQLRTPLSTINWYAEMLIDQTFGKMNAKQMNYLKQIHGGNRRMIKLVNNLLSVSRLEMGTLLMESKEIDLVKILNQEIINQQFKANEKEIELKVTITNKSIKMMGDGSIINMVFQNLISNAIKYTPNKGSVEIKLKKLKAHQKVEGRQLSKEAVLFSVKDNGMGIPKSQQNKIFSKLFRASNAQKSDTNGNGLGLYIVQSVIRKMKGKLWFKSEKNKGTEFYAIMPLIQIKK